jgi:peptidoglycan-associated lipoprotein
VADPEAASAQPFDAGLNSTGQRRHLCFNRDFTEIFSPVRWAPYKGDDQFCKIYTATRRRRLDGLAPLPFRKKKSTTSTRHFRPTATPSFSPATTPKAGAATTSGPCSETTTSESGWDVPKLLSRNINTPGNEVFPTFSADTLYFASDGLPGMGGLDIFRTYKLTAQRLGHPAQPQAARQQRRRRFRLHRRCQPPQKHAAAARRPAPGRLFHLQPSPGGRGGDDIYRFEQRVPPPKPPKVDTTPAKPLVYKMILEGYVLEKILSDPTDPNSRVLGRKPLAGANRWPNYRFR